MKFMVVRRGGVKGKGRDRCSGVVSVDFRGFGYLGTVSDRLVGNVCFF